jgi:uncharacterized membrane protein
MNFNQENYYSNNSSDLREIARGSLRKNWTSALLVTAVATLFGPLTGPEAHWLLDLVGFLTGGALLLGSVHYFLKLNRDEGAQFTDLFYGFKQFISSFLTYLLFILFILLWTLLLIIPGIIAGLRYAMTFYILNDEPELKPLQAIKRSSEMMRGYKWDFFKLQLSFIGWYLLTIIGGLITIGLLPGADMGDRYWSSVIIAVFILPVVTYSTATSAAFYVNRKAMQQQEDATLHQVSSE